MSRTVGKDLIKSNPLRMGLSEEYAATRLDSCIRAGWEKLEEFGDVSATRCKEQSPTWSRCLNELVASVDSTQMVFLLHVIREMSKSLRIFDSRFVKLLVLWSLKVRLPSWDTMGRGVPWTVLSLENWSCWRGQAWFEQRSFLDKLKKGNYFIPLIGGFGVVVHDTFWGSGSLFNQAKIGNDWKCTDTTWSTRAQQWSYWQVKWMIRQTNQHDPSTVHPEENGKGTVEKVEIGRVYKVY